MTSKRLVSTIVLSFLIISVLAAQTTRQRGVIRGVVSDSQGSPLPGVSVTATSPALLGSMSSITGESGAYRCTNLPPGKYTVTAEIPGFKTMQQNEIDVRVGITLTVNFSMEQTELSEEITVVAANPTVDVQSFKLSTRVDAETLAKLPINREFSNIISTAPGVVEDFSSSKMSGMGTGTIHGGTAYSQSFEVDGVNVVDPAHGGAIIYSPQYDSIEEVSIETGGLDAQVGNTAGNFINIVTKSGGNEFHGAASVFYTEESLTQSLLPDEQLTSLGMVKPSAPIYDYDISASLGGPIIRDKIWFFTSMTYENQKQRGNFIPTTLEGKSYDTYDYPNSFQDFMLKISTQIHSNLRFYLTGAYSDQDLKYNTTSAYNTLEAIYTKSNNRRMTLSGQLSWHISSNSILDIRGGFAHFDYPIAPLEPEYNGIGKYDAYTYYTWQGSWSWASDIDRSSSQISARLTQYVDDFLGGNHEIGMGLEYQYGSEKWWLYRDVPILRYYWNGSPYYYRGLYGLDGPHPVFGDGRILTQTMGPSIGGTGAPSLTGRFGGYIQDAFTISNRLTINLGIRFDSTKGWVTDAKKELAGGITPAIGEYAIVPTYGFNPFSELTTPDWDPAMKWSPISPRVGISYDLFGNGKTALKASYARYADSMPAMYFQGNHPFSQSQWGWNPLYFYWWDDNGNGDIDAPPFDRYELAAGAVSDYDPDPNTYHIKIDSDIKAPTYNEFIVGLDHELMKNFSIGVKYFYRNKKNTLDTVLFDRGSNKNWYTYEQAPEWYVPFTTTVPGIGDYEDTDVTVYLISKDAPWQNRFYQFTNVEESKRTYQALEVTFDKRFSDGWSLGGSLVYSETYGNVAGTGGVAHGMSGAFDNANYFINREGRDLRDRPLAIKLFGVFEAPLGLFASFYYTHFSGFPFQRTVTVSPPSDWADANNALPLGFTVNVEQQGSRRQQSIDNLDFRLEKEFAVSDFGKLGVYLDVYNLLGNRYSYSGVDPGGTWIPDGPNTTSGRYVASSNYGRLTSVEGVRIFKFSIRFTF